MVKNWELRDNYLIGADECIVHKIMKRIENK